MHDIDRTQRELEMEAEHEHEHEHELQGESVLSQLFGEAEQEAAQEAEAEAEGEGEGEVIQEQEQEQEWEAESPLNEAQEMELAAELLEVSSEAELEYFLGNLFRKAVGGVKSFARSAAGRRIGGMLKGLAKKALPIAGTAVGAYFGGPGGAKIGGSLGKFASNLFELELEGLSHEDREFEIARQVVRLGASAASQAARASRALPPPVVARRAFTSAARVYAPGLLRRRTFCRACAAAGRGAPGPGRPHRHGSATGRPTIVRRADGTTSVIAGPRALSGEPVYDSTPGVVGDVPSAYPMASRGGRWFRRGRQIVLTGL